MEQNDPRLQSALSTVIDWMNEQMYDQHTVWTYGDEHDRMWAACNLLMQLCINKNETEDEY